MFAWMAPAVVVAMTVQAGSPGVIESAHSAKDIDLVADPTTADWRDAPRVTIDLDYFGKPVAGPPTEVRSRWTNTHLYLLYICKYDTLNLKPNPDTVNETPRLWNWDVGEAFIGWDFNRITSYKELQVSPQGEWVDLDIDRENPKTQQGMAWNSGYTVRARIDAASKTWFGLMKIPFSAIDTRTPEKGRELRIGLYRIAGTDQKVHYAWRPTGEPNFHVPKAFGILRLR